MQLLKNLGVQLHPSNGGPGSIIQLEAKITLDEPGMKLVLISTVKKLKKSHNSRTTFGQFLLYVTIALLSS